MTLLYRKLNYKEYKRGKVDAKGWNECGKGWERREKERRRSPGTKNKASFVAVARGAIRPAFQLTGRRCFRVQPCRKLDLFTRRLRSEPRRTEARHDKFQKSIPLPNEQRLFRLAPPKTRGRCRAERRLSTGVIRCSNVEKMNGVDGLPFGGRGTESTKRRKPSSLALLFFRRSSLLHEEFPSGAVLYCPAKFTIDTESRILRNNSIAATPRRPV